MDSENRPDPEELLKAVQHEEELQKRGQLKIFLGMAAGVGKTFEMLQEAQKLRREGVNVVVGIVDTHERSETAALLEGLKSIPQKKVEYKGTAFLELDIDEILKVKPDLVLIDEFAHTNVPGSRHLKRWQDVLEVLDNGIDVYTTLNVQHIESLNDVVESIAGIQIRESVPDSIIESATFIELVDIPPNELLKRLREGKVYLGNQPQIAIKNFFQEDRLTALREILLRYAAEKVDHDLHGMVSTTSHKEAWRPRERLLVAVSHSPHSKKLIRTTRRLAFTLDAPWIAVHINDGKVLDDEEMAMLSKNLALARELGAEVLAVNDQDIAEAIQRIAKQKDVTQIVIGRPPKRPIADFFQRYTLLDRLAKECSDIDIHVIRQEQLSSSYRRKMLKFSTQSQSRSYLLVVCYVLLLAAFNWAILPFIGYKVTGFIFLLGILSLSLFFRKGPIFLASTLYAIIWDFFFIPPKGTLLMTTIEDDILVGLYFLTAIVTGTLADRARQNKEMLLKREARTEALYEIVHDIASTASIRQLMGSIKKRLGTLFEGTFEIFIKGNDDRLVFEDLPFLGNNEKEKNAAIWVAENGKEAGWSTSTLPLCQYLYMPIKGYRGVVGVLAYRPKMPNRELSLEEKNFFYTVGNELASCLERTSSVEKK